MPQERRIINGYIVERQPDGTLVTIGPAEQMPADPSFQYEGPRAQADLEGARANADRARADTRVTEATAPTTISTANLGEGMMWVDPSDPSKGQTPIPTVNPRVNISGAQRSEGIQGFTASMALSNVIADLEARFAEGPGATSGLGGVRDYLPTEANQRFDRAANAARGTVGDVLGFTGGQLNSMGEAQMNVGPFIPSASDRDETIRDAINRLKELQQQGIDRSVAILGGVPDANGNIIPVPEGVRPNAMTVPRIVARDPSLTAAGSGATTTSEPIPAAMQQEYQTWVLNNIGSMTPESYAAFRSSLDEKYGFAPGADYSSEGQRMLEGIQNGGTLNLTIPPIEREMNGGERFQNDMANSTVGAAMIGMADAGGFGVPTMLAPEQMAALRQERGGAMLAGDVAGAMTGTALLGRAGRATVGRALPRIMAGGGPAQFGRNLAADATYAGIYGANTGQNPLEAAGIGALGSAGGQLAAKGIGAAARGVATSAPVDYLRSQNIPLTVGQTLGGAANRFEERAMSVPLVGDMIRARRMEGLEAFNREAFDQAGRRIGVQPSQTGMDGMAALETGLEDAYTQATSGARVPLDNQFLADLDAMEARAAYMPDDRQRELLGIINARVLPLAEAGEVTGDTFNQSTRGLRAARNNVGGVVGFEDVYRDRITDAENAISDLMERGGGQHVVEGLRNARAANRDIRTLEDAVTRARAGSATETPFEFTPYQLQSAGIATQRRFPGERPFAEMADAGQEVLPNRMPNSGTADRAMQAMLPGLAAGGAGAGYAMGEDLQSTAGGAVGLPALVAAAAMLGGTRRGQAALTRAITQQRPASLRRLGDFALNRSGLFGSAAMAPMVVGY